MSQETDRVEKKPAHLDRLSPLWRRLNEHKIAQWSVAYVALAYAIQHAIILTSESFEWPSAVARVSMLLLALGLPLVVTFAWYHGARASRNFSQAELSILAALLVMSSLLFYVFVRPSEPAAAPLVQQASVTAARNAAASPKGVISLAVLPFVNLSSDKEQEFFSDGITEEITAALAKVPDLRVVARTSAFEFKGQNRDVETIGQQLHATHLIEGSVRKAGDRVRITVQLIKVDDGTHIWSENYDRQLTDVFAIQEDIARRVTASFNMSLNLKPGENLVNNRDIDPESYLQFLRARALLDARGVAEATALLEQIVVHQPNYAPAWAALAQAYGLAPNRNPARDGTAEEFRRVVDAYFSKADAALRRAIQLDPNLADAYRLMAARYFRGGRALEGEEYYLRAAALDPAVAFTHARALNLEALGQVKEGLAAREQLQTIEPFVPLYKRALVGSLWMNGRNDDAIAMAKTLEPEASAQMLAMIYASMSRYKEAADYLMQVPPGAYPPGSLEEAVRLLRVAPAKAAMPQKLPALGTFLAWVYLSVGAESRVLDNYETLLDGGRLPGQEMGWLWHPSYAPVRKAERFKAFVRKAGFVDYWKAKGWPPQCHPTTGDDFACE